MSSTVEQVKSRLTIVDVVSSYLTLERAGANLRARCPFHNEKTPSFYVSPTRETYHCFGCNRGGDIFTFVEEIEGLDFLGALKVLAQKAGVNIEPSNNGSREVDRMKARLYDLLNTAADFFSSHLANNSEALDYLKKRGLKSETIREFRLGFAPAGWRTLIDHLRDKGYTEKEIDQSGLAIRGRDRRLLDRFRSRITFPLADSAGRIIGYSGRIFNTLNGPDQSKEAKYINSPDTQFYDKSKVLYLFDRAKLALRKMDHCVLVEGQFDAVLAHQAGTLETVAVSGTALSVDHLRLIKRLTRRLIMSFDADPAGIRASSRAINLALSEGFEVRVVPLPLGQDPADLIQESVVKWQEGLSGALHVIDFLLEVHKTDNLPERELAHNLEREVYPFVASLANEIDRAYFIKKIADLVHLPERVIQNGVVQAKSHLLGDKTKIDNLEKSKPFVSRRERLEELIVGFCFLNGDRDKDIKAKIVDYWGKDFFDERRSGLVGRESELSIKIEMTYGKEVDSSTILNTLLNEWQEEVWREELGKISDRIKQLGKNADEAETEKYLKRCQELSQKINNLRN